MSAFLIASARTSVLLANNLSWFALGFYCGPEFLGLATFSLAFSGIAVNAVGMGFDSAMLYVPSTAKPTASMMLGARIASAGFAAFGCFWGTPLLLHAAPAGLAFASALLCIAGVSSTVEVRAIRVEGPERVILIRVALLFVAIIARCVIAIETKDVVYSLLPTCIYEVVSVMMLFHRKHYCLDPIRLRKVGWKALKRAAHEALPLYKVGIINTLVQKLVQTYSAVVFGPSTAGLVALHLAPFDAYGSFCSTYAQQAYVRNQIPANLKGLGLALRPVVALTWLCFLTIILAAAIHPAPLALGRATIFPGLLVIAGITMFVYSFGAFFSHWMVILGQRNVLPQFHIMSLTGLVVLLAALYPLGAQGIILARPLSSIMGHAGMAAVKRDQRGQWRVLWTSIVWPFGLGR